MQHYKGIPGRHRGLQLLVPDTISDLRLRALEERPLRLLHVRLHINVRLLPAHLRSHEHAAARQKRHFQLAAGHFDARRFRYRPGRQGLGRHPAPRQEKRPDSGACSSRASRQFGFFHQAVFFLPHQS